MNSSPQKTHEYEVVYTTSNSHPKVLGTNNRLGAEHRANVEAVFRDNAARRLKYIGMASEPMKQKIFIQIPGNGRPNGEILTAAQLTDADRAFLAEPPETTLQSLVRRVKDKIAIGSTTATPVRQNRPSRKPPADPMAKRHADMGAQVDKFQKEETAAYKGMGLDPRNIDRAAARENEKHKSQMKTMKGLDESLAKALPSAKAKDVMTMD